MFTETDRTALRATLLDELRADPRVSGGAITGSAALGAEDRWSDIDLAFGVRGEIAPVLADATARMYDRHAAVHHVDVHAGAWIYRVFLRADTLQIDLAFAPASDFCARAPSFALVFGESAPPRHAPPPAAELLLGMAWLHALHARSALARARPWQAAYMIAGARDRVLALACLRHGLPAADARGVDRLPCEVTEPLRGSFGGLDELAAAFRLVMAALIREAEQLAIPALPPVLRELARVGVDSEPCDNY